MGSKHSQVQAYIYNVYHIWFLGSEYLKFNMCHILIIEVLTYAAFWLNTYQSDYITDNVTH